MIDFKYHVVSLISVFLAVALGIVIGTTVLNGGIVDNLHSQVTALTQDKRGLEGRVDGLNAQTNTDQKFDAAVAPGLVAGNLTGQSVIVINAGDSVSADDRDAVVKMIQASGGKITGSITLTNSFSDPKQSSNLLNFASSGSLPAGLSLPVSSDAGIVIGGLLAQTLMKPATGDPMPDASISSILAGLGGLGVLKVDTSNVTPATNFVIITRGTAPDPASARNQMLLGLTSALNKVGGAVVIAGDTPSNTSGGLVAAARSTAAITSVISTVDNSDATRGQISVVWALAAASTGGPSGKYGNGSGTQPAPPQPK